MPNFRFRAIIDIDVQNADTEASAREKAFAIMSAANAQPSRGRTPSGPKASVTGIAIEDNRFAGQMAAHAAQIWGHSKRTTGLPTEDDFAALSAEKESTAEVTE